MLVSMIIALLGALLVGMAGGPFWAGVMTWILLMGLLGSTAS